MHTTAIDEESGLPMAIVTRRVAVLRAITGLLQGVLLYLLYSALKRNGWPANEPYVFAPLLMFVLFLPVLLVSSLGHLRPQRILAWMLLASLICAALGYYDIWRAYHNGFSWFGISRSAANPVPSGMVMLFTAIGFYIAHSLILAGAAEKKLIAGYPSHFEAAWKLAIQIKFSIIFALVLWAILWIGSALFMLVKLHFLDDLLKEAWFAIPVTAFAFSFALHLTDVRPGIVHGIRSLLLVLMSWLLPLTVLIVGGFLISLPFTGLAPLWATRHATQVLLGTASILVVLINATFQSGQVAVRVTPVLRLAARIACVLLLPIILIAIYALSLRVQQYGWTNDRIAAAACLAIGSCYACAYLWAALEKGSWLARIAPANIVTAFVLLTILLALFTPIADPARLSVANQVARLEDGRISADSFDFSYLYREGARYGKSALKRLAEQASGKDAALIRSRAALASAQASRDNSTGADQTADTAARRANIMVRPQTKALPDDFVKQDWADNKNKYSLPACLKLKNHPCDAYLIDLNGDNKVDILLRDIGTHAQLIVFTIDASGKWIARGTMQYTYGACDKTWEALAEGRYQLASPEFKDMEVDGRRLRMEPWFWPEERCKN